MLRVPSPDEEDHRRAVRERKALLNERIRHVNRIKGLLFNQGISGYEPLNRDRRERLDALVTGDGRLLPTALRAQISRELDRLELLIKQIGEVEEGRNAMLARAEKSASEPALLLNLKGIGPEFAAVLWTEGPSRHFDNRSRLPLTQVLRQRRGKVARSVRNRVYLSQAIPDCARRLFNSHGCGYVISPLPRSPHGSRREWRRMAVARRNPQSSPLRANFSWRSGSTSTPELSSRAPLQEPDESHTTFISEISQD